MCHSALGVFEAQVYIPNKSLLRSGAVALRSGAVALRAQTYMRSVVALTVVVDVYLQRVAEQRQSSRSRDLGHELRRPQPLVVVEIESQSQHE